MLDRAAALIGDPAKALQIDGTSLRVAGLRLVAVRLMHNRLILFAGRLLFLLRRRRRRSGFGLLFAVGQVDIHLIFFLYIQNGVRLVLAVSSFGLRGVRHHHQRFAGATVRGIAARVSESHLSVFEDQLAEVNRSIKNVMSAIEKGIITETTKGRLMELEAERTAIEGKICAAKAAIVPTNRERLVEWLRSLREGDVHDKKYQAGLFDTFLVAAYLYDDNRVKIVFSFAGDKNTIEIPLEDVIDSIDDEASCVRLSSTLSHQKKWT